MNVIWCILIAVSVIFAVVNGRMDAFTKSIFDGAKAAVEVSLFLAGIVSLWLGMTKILDEAGLIQRISRFVQPVIRRFFKGIPEGHPSIASMTLNILANVFGLGNAATPFGIKAMQELQTLAPDKETLTFEMMLFVVVNTASLQVIPFTVIGILAAFGSTNPAAVVLPTLLTSSLTAASAIGTLFLFRKIFK
jgi:spore maturation protein A